jgi:hypothetical protein
MATSRTRGPRKPLIEIPPIQTEAIVAAQNLGDILSTPEGQALNQKAQEAGRYLGLLEATKAALDVAKFEDMAEKAQKIQSEKEVLEGRLRLANEEAFDMAFRKDIEIAKLTLQPEDTAWLAGKSDFDKWLTAMIVALPPVGHRKGYGYSWNPDYGDLIIKKIVESQSAIEAEKAISAASDKRAEEKAALVVQRDATIASLKSQVEKARQSSAVWETTSGTLTEQFAIQMNRTDAANRLAFAFGMLALSGFLLQVGDYYRPADKIGTIAALLVGIVSLLTFGVLLLDKFMSGLAKADARMEEDSK